MAREAKEEIKEELKEEVKVKKFKIEVIGNPSFCGIDAGGVQFANGQAVIPEGRMVEWFKEHSGYKVSEV